MARKKADDKFLILKDLEDFKAKLISRRGKRFIPFVTEVCGTAYATISNKFSKNKVEIAIRNNVERFFDNEDLKLENKELKERLSRISNELQTKK